MEEKIASVISFADRAHGEQLRKYSGDRYIVHPIRVMKICEAYTKDIAVLSAALLHDVLEDTETREEEIYRFLSGLFDDIIAKKTIDLVVDLTDVYVKEKFPNLNRRTRKQKEVARLTQIAAQAQTIKYADIIDNSLDITKNDIDFARVYLREMHQLLLEIDKGHAELYIRAQDTVKGCIAELKR